LMVPMTSLRLKPVLSKRLSATSSSLDPCTY
jgi:hypothetical protein